MRSCPCFEPESLDESLQQYGFLVNLDRAIQSLVSSVYWILDKKDLSMAIEPKGSLGLEEFDSHPVFVYSMYTREEGRHDLLA